MSSSKLSSRSLRSFLVEDASGEPTKDRTERVRFFVNSIPVGVNGFTLAAGLSFLGNALARPVGASSGRNRRILGTGVEQGEDFWKIVFGVRGLSESRRARTFKRITEISVEFKKKTALRV